MKSELKMQDLFLYLRDRERRREKVSKCEKKFETSVFMFPCNKITDYL